VPLASQGVSLDKFQPEQLLCKSTRSLGHGTEQSSDVVYVKTQISDFTKAPQIAAQVGAFNAKLHKAGNRFILIGPGRWGSRDHSLGIPVEWAHISGVKIIVEVPFNNRAVEPSLGTHFFHNITSLRIGYLTIGSPGSDPTGENFIDFAWLNGLEAVEESEYVRHIRLPQPLAIILDGKNGCGVIVKPGEIDKIKEPEEAEFYGLGV
jgi:hypothetical protein